MTQEFLAGTIDHTLLKPDADSHQFTQLFEEAIHYGFHSVCVNASRVEEATKFFKDNHVKVCSVVGFPLGASTTSTKLKEMESCIQDGAVEIDMVMNIGYYKDGNLDYVANEIVQMVNSASGNILKVIIETNLLNEDEIIQASKLVVDSGAQFVKTSTGFCGRGATPDLVQLIRSAVRPETGIKASGGIKTLEQVEALIDAGANRIGTSSGVIIMKEFSQKRFKFVPNLNDKFE